MNYFKLLLILVILDLIWLKLFFGKYFLRMINNIQNENVEINYIGVLISYISLFYLAVIFLPKTNNDFEAFLLGMLVYAIYDGTNLALFKKYELKLAIIDIIWGGILFYSTKKLVNM